MTGGHPYIFNDASEPIIGPRTPSGVSSANDPATVCVRLDGLADKIAAALGDEWDKGTTTESEAAVIVALLIAEQVK